MKRPAMRLLGAAGEGAAGDAFGDAAGSVLDSAADDALGITADSAACGIPGAAFGRAKKMTDEMFEEIEGYVLCAVSPAFS